MRALWVSVALLANGCALTMSANAHHNSGGTACVNTPAFAIIDLAIGFAGTAAVTASEESAGYYAIPGVFFASGVIGGVSAVACGESDDEKAAIAAPPASNSAPSFGEAPVDPDAVDVTQTQLEPEPTEPAPPLHPVLKLRLPEGYDVPATVPMPPQRPSESKPPDPQKIPCRDAPSSCPPSQTCAIAGDDAGFCVPASDN